MISRILTSLVDKACQDTLEAQPKRTYLGSSIIGTPCERQLWFKYTNYPVDKGKEFSGKIIRIFDRGHTLENNIIQYLKDSGFEFKNTGEDQLGFEDGNIKGHADGIIIRSPLKEIPTPCLFEAKCLNTKSWSWLSNKGLVSKPEYHTQVNLYMHYLDLSHCLFVALNANDMTMYFELVPYNEGVALEAIEKGKRVLSYRNFKEAPKIANSGKCFSCDWCSYRNSCNPLT